MEIFADGAIELNDNEVFHNCSYSCYANIADALNELKAFEDIGMTPEEIKSFLTDFGISIIMKNRELKKQHEEDKEIIAKMAERRQKELDVSRINFLKNS